MVRTWRVKIVMVVSCIIMLIYAKLIFEKRSDRKSGGAADLKFLKISKNIDFDFLKNYFSKFDEIFRVYYQM